MLRISDMDVVNSTGVNEIGSYATTAAFVRPAAAFTSDVGLSKSKFILCTFLPTASDR